MQGTPFEFTNGASAKAAYTKVSASLVHDPVLLILKPLDKRSIALSVSSDVLSFGLSLLSAGLPPLDELLFESCITHFVLPVSIFLTLNLNQVAECQLLDPRINEI